MSASATKNAAADPTEREMDSLDSSGRKIVPFSREMPVLAHRADFIHVFESAPEFAETRAKMRSDMIESLKSLAPLKERAKAQSFLDILASAVASSGVSHTTQTYESLGEALPKYIETIEASIYDRMVAKGVNVPFTEGENILLDWILQPFFSKFVSTADRSQSCLILFSVSCVYVRLCLCMFFVQLVYDWR